MEKLGVIVLGILLVLNVMQIPKVYAAETLIDSYIDGETGETLRAQHPSTQSSKKSAIGQSFTTLGDKYKITRAKFYLKRWVHQLGIW